MKWDNPYVSVQSKIESLERWLLVHAIIYYEYNNNIVTDTQWDTNAYQLVDMIKQYPKDFKASYYYILYKEFDGSTGFDLPDGLKEWNREHYDYLDIIASHVVYRSDKGNGKKVAKKEK